MIEDDVYRASSQYRYWSYTKESLARIRQNTNDLASERVKAAFRRVHASKQAHHGAKDDPSGNGAQNGTDDLNVQTLTVEEELKVVEWGCSKITDMGEAMNPRIPSHIMATAIQYLRRFYLTNSVMTYNPRQIIACALYLATKADHFYISLSKFVAELEGVTEDDVKAPEFLLLQGLRFTLDVRHPMKGLAGGHIEMNVMAEEGQLGTISTSSGAAKRIGVAADHAKRLLATAAQMTDAYFLYTPSQIWLAAIMVADRELLETYLDHKMSSLPSGDSAATLKHKLVSTISACATLLESWRSPEDDAPQRKEIRRIGKKLTVCQNPEKTDIVAVAKAKAAEKREGDGSDAEKALKKRKLEREKLEKDGDVFGPALKDLP
ncbi:cyclin H [Exophiala viscosa]|uniref:RNA polymerase II holoenzyme cyclin-like subunit n=1 Tax=Exophiala viscosa TaxID=2486360 RepID=A0AAN6IDX0_9EURO|nr:cyclin H [Exophiala viscosa]